MKKILQLILALLLLELTFQQCANPISPTGGPKDTIPPVLIQSNPTIGRTNFNGKELELEFSELIIADKLKQELTILPKIKNQYKSTVRKNKLELKFVDEFQDSTTYYLNFANGVGDVTEKNSVVNLILAFSTGPTIDSLELTGNVIDLYNQKPVKGITAGLYPDTDTLDILIHSPIYTSKTDESGKFHFRYLKNGIYKLITFDDTNKNQIFDPETESHGFIAEPITLDTITNIEKAIPVLLQNIKPITLLYSKPTGAYHEIRYSKNISTYKISDSTIYSKISGDNKDILRLYKPSKINFGDTLELIIETSDDYKNNTIDTIKSVFLESNRKPEQFSFQLSSEKEALDDDHVIIAEFNKPILTVDSSKFAYTKDSTILLQVHPSFTWNDNHTRLLINTKISKAHLIDTLAEIKKKDSTLTEIQHESERPAKDKNTQLKTITFESLAGAFTSVEADTSDNITLEIQIENTEKYGKIRFTIISEHQRYKIQLLQKEKVIYELTEGSDLILPKVKPGNYTIRVLIDTNQNGTWSPGNILRSEEPEEIYLYPDEASIRENWEVDIDLTF